MQSDKWGKSGWIFMHTISFNYPDKPTQKDMENYKFFFTNISEVLPCKYCRESYKNFIMEIPIEPALKSRKLLTRWLYKIHNKVNNKLRKQGLLHEKNPKYSDICSKYDKMRALCSTIKETCRKRK